MAAGHTHARVAWLAMGIGGGAAVVLAASKPELTPLAAAFVGGLLNGLLVTPDIDIQHATHEELRWRRVWIIGFLLQVLFMTFWFPYALLFEHRGISHWPIVGTLTRFVYQFGLLALLAYVFGRWPIADPVHHAALALLALAYLAGWIVQDIGHIALD